MGLAMKTLLVLRHAAAGWHQAGLGDHDRPLTEQGEREAPAIGQLVGELGLRPDLILSSTAVRARLTTELVSARCGYEGEVAWVRSLYLGQAEAYVEALAGWGNGYERVMVVGHNPGLQTLVAGLTGQMAMLGTAGLARVDLAVSTWSRVRLNGRGQLAGFWGPEA